MQPPQRGFARTTNELYFGNPAVDVVSIAGPYRAPRHQTDTPSRRAVFSCRPSSRPARRRTVRARDPLASRPPRLSPAGHRTGSRRRCWLLQGGTARRKDSRRAFSGAPANSGVSKFPVPRRTGAGQRAPGGVYRINDIDLASRLSFFLWSSIPDDELLDVAERGTLSTPAVLEQQVRRMLRDPRSDALVDNFATQWLTIGKLSGVVPDVDAYPEFDENLRDAFRQETRLFISSQLREDRSVGELLTANYTYVNERLARHYQIPNVFGSHFRRVTFGDGRRGGLLGQGSILTVTSYPNRTSPVLRGRWLLENILGAPPPPPPPDVPSLPEGGSDGRLRSVREQMEAHRKNPACAVCHVRMDPLGFSLENFDALGKWRTTVDDLPIDASASLPDGTKFDGVLGLRQLMASHQEDFARTFTQKLLGYRSDEASRRRIFRPSVRSPSSLPQADTAGHRSSWGSSGARRSR